MYQKILERNKKFIKNQKLYSSFNTELQSAVNILNDKNIITISGLRHTGKTKLIYAILKKTESFEKAFYYNSELDTLGSIQSHEDLITLLDIHVRIHGVPKIIILQNTNNIEGIKQFISQLYKTKKYKLIIVGNNIMIEGVKELELFPAKIDIKNIENSIYGGITEVRIIPDVQYKKYLLSILKNDIVSRDILEAYSIKNISLFYQIITYISQLSSYHSLREMHRDLKTHGIDISLLTMIDYINAALNTKLLSRVYLHDIKNNNTIQSKAQYFFGDVGIRKAFCEEVDTLENLLYIELRSRGYTVSGGLNGRFQFEFYAQKDGNTLCIALDTSNDKNEIRKTARKLEKLHDRSQKFVVLQEKENLNMRKFQEDSVKMVTLSELLSYVR